MIGGVVTVELVVSCVSVNVMGNGPPTYTTRGAVTEISNTAVGVFERLKNDFFSAAVFDRSSALDEHVKLSFPILDIWGPGISV